MTPCHVDFETRSAADLKRTGELWKPVVGFEGMYEVSSLGRVRSLDRVLVSEGARRGYPRKVKGRLLMLQRHSGGYVQVSLGESGVRLVHALVLEAFVGPCPVGMESCHDDGDKTNNFLFNLRYDTHSANCEDRRRHGVSYQGEANAQAKLTEDDVREIRSRKGETYKDIASGFPVSDRAIGKVVRGERWRHV